MALMLASPGSAGAAAQAAKAPSPVVAENDAGMMKSKVRGTTDDGRKVFGTFTPSSFEMSDGKLMANGTLDMVVRGKGKPEALPTETVSMEVVGANAPSTTAAGGKGMPAAAAGTCDILNLVLGPLDLNLLGLEIHLDTVVLDIIANPAGGLLGQLLCAVANLLSSGPLAGLLTQLQALLTQILGVLNGLGL
jgi:hypothetical protein